MTMQCNRARWAFNINTWQPTEAHILLATSCLQSEEKSRIGKFVFKRDFKASLIGRLLMRKFVSLATDIPYNEILFDRDDRSKPYCKNKIGGLCFDFNVSHQGSFTVLAGEMGNNKVGVDIMKMEYTGGKSVSEFFRLMTRNFSASEWETIRKLPDEKAQVQMFYRHWCLKESYVKNIGVGITVNLQNISFDVKTTQLSQNSVIYNTDCAIHGVELDNWIFEESLLDEEHCVAVSLNSPNTILKTDSIFQNINIDELLANAVPLNAKDLDFCAKYFAKDEKPLF